MKNVLPENRVKVSVILPTYNVEAYFREAIESVLRQSLADIEIIPVNDGSPDNCGAIMDEYAQKDGRVKPIHKKNGGYGSAVNAGIRAATGEYIAIVEPDDYIVDDLLYILHTEAKENNLDICRFNSYLEIREYMSPVLKRTYFPGQHDILSEKNLAELFANAHAGVWLGLYKRSLLIDHNVWMDENNKAYHDVDFVALSYLAASRIKIIETCGYFYRRDVPTQSVSDLGRAYCMIDATRRIWREAKLEAISPLVMRGLTGYVLGHLSHYWKRVKANFSGSPLEKSFHNEISRYVSNPAFGNILCTKALANSLARDFSCSLPIEEVNSYRVASLKEFVLVKNMRLDGSYSLSQVYAICYMKMAIFLGDQQRVILDYFCQDIWSMMATIFPPGNSTLIKVINSSLRLFDQRVLLFEKPHFYTRLMSYLIESGEMGAIDSFWSCRHVNSALDREMCYFPSSVEKIGNHKSSKFPDEELYFSLKKFSANEQKFLSYIRGKSIAVVGNSPCEIGLGKGKLIDEHDVVIRFNNYELNSNLSADYGAKEDVWFFSPNLPLIFPREDMSKYSFIGSPLVSRDLSKSSIDFYKAIDGNSNFFRMNIHGDASRRANVTCPSVGVYTLIYLDVMCNGFKSLSLFGFALTDYHSGVRHYFSGDKNHDAGRVHAWERERTYLDEFRARLERRKAYV